MSSPFQLPPRAVLSIALGDPSLESLQAGALSGWEVHAVNDLQTARRLLKSQHFCVGLLLISETLGPEINELDRLLEAFQSTQWVGVFPATLTKQPPYRSLVVQHLFDFYTWPVDGDHLRHTLGHAYGFAELDQSADSRPSRRVEMALVGNSGPMLRLRRQIVKVAAANAPVLIWGESGSGKELTAQAIHQQSSRAAGPFVALNCGAMPAGLIQSELFGHERGAFTGAVRDKQGLIESASGGTLFLDEIGDLPLELQANLLRFLQEHTINRIGSLRDIHVDVRVIAASHMRLEDAVSTGRFREDLLYRLNVLPLTVPALRDRKQDLPELTQHFFRQFASDKSARLTGFSQRAMSAIMAHDWPGNVRELINCIRRAMVMSEGRLITPEDLGLVPQADEGNGDRLDEARVQAEQQTIQASLLRNGNNITHTARELGVSRMTLYRLLHKYRITS